MLSRNSHRDPQPGQALEAVSSPSGSLMLAWAGPEGRRGSGLPRCTLQVVPSPERTPLWAGHPTVARPAGRPPSSLADPVTCFANFLCKKSYFKRPKLSSGTSQPSNSSWARPQAAEERGGRTAALTLGQSRPDTWGSSVDSVSLPPAAAPGWRGSRGDQVWADAPGCRGSRGNPARRLPAENGHGTLGAHQTRSAPDMSGLGPSLPSGPAGKVSSRRSPVPR